MTQDFRDFRYQTGEVMEIARKLKEGLIVPVDIDYDEELDVLIKDLEQEGIYKVNDLPYDEQALDLVEQPEFRFRIAFYTEPAKVGSIDKNKLMYMDVFTIEEPEESYDEVFWG